MAIIRGNYFFPQTIFLSISNGKNHRMRLICSCKEHPHVFLIIPFPALQDKNRKEQTQIRKNHDDCSRKLLFRTTFLPVSCNEKNLKMRLICPCKEHAPSRVLYYSILSPCLTRIMRGDHGDCSRKLLFPSNYFPSNFFQRKKITGCD